MKSLLRLIALVAILSAAACASVPPPSPIIDQANAADRRIGGGS